MNLYFLIPKMFYFIFISILFKVKSLENDRSEDFSNQQNLNGSKKK